MKTVTKTKNQKKTIRNLSMYEKRILCDKLNDLSNEGEDFFNNVLREFFDFLHEFNMEPNQIDSLEPCLNMIWDFFNITHDLQINLKTEIEDWEKKQSEKYL